jgi:hypothetical protein
MDVTNTINKIPDIPVEILKPVKLSLKAKVSGFFAKLGKKRKIAGGIIGMVVLTASLAAGVYLSQNVQNTTTQAGGVVLSLSSNNTSPKINETFIVAVAIDTKGENVSAVDLGIKYDADKLEATNIKPIGDFLPTILRQGKIDAANTQSGITIALGCPIDQNGGYPKSGTGVLAEITFKVKASGSTSISFGSNTAVAVVGQTANAIGTSNSVTINVPGPATPQPASTPAATPIFTTIPSALPSTAPTLTPAPVGNIQCDSFATAHINSCDSAAKSTSSPRDPACVTTSTSATLYLASSDAQTVGIATDVPFSTLCSALSDSSFSSPVAYSSTFNITLPGGTGDKKVCVRLISASGAVGKCGGTIYLSQ